MKFLFIILFATTLHASASFKAADVMKKNEAARRITQLKASGKIVIDGGQRKRQEKTFTWWRQLQKDGVHYNTLTKFHTPAAVKDQAILFLESEGDKNEILMWLPTFKKTRIIESSQQNGSFMASDFSFSDITALQNEDYNYKEEGIEACPNTKDQKDLKCFKITATLKNAKSADRLGYSKLLLWIRNDNHMSDRVHYFDKSGNLFKELDTTSISEISKGSYFFSHLHMKNLTNGQFTLLEFSNLDAKTKISENKFFKQRLGKDD
jgi:hypothetical protein